MVTLTAAGMQRSYLLVVPQSYVATTAYPLILGWHAIGSTGAQARTLFDIEGGDAIFAYPDGLPPTNRRWDTSSAASVDVAFFDSLVSEISGAYCVNPQRIFSAGFSMGAFLVARLGCWRGNVLRAIAVVSGNGVSGTCTGEVASWHAHGLTDATIPFSQGDSGRQFFADRNGCAAATQDVSPVPCVANIGCAADLPVHMCAHGGGHEWPSFAGSGIWSFFDSFR